MSLWAVEDESARRWMKALYEARLERNLGTSEAVREASLQILRFRRRNDRSTHPLFWAGFVATGDWK
jgi:CHAT domain-containing protein